MSESPLKPSANASVQFLRGALEVVAAIVLVGGCIIAGLYVYGPGASPPPAQTVILSLGTVLFGLLLAAILLAASAIMGLLASAVNRLHAPPSSVEDVRAVLDRLEQSLRMLNSLQGRADGIRGGADGLAGPAGGRGEGLMTAPGNVLGLLEQIRDLSLMDEGQRERAAAHYWLRRKRAYSEAIERDVLVGDWVAAFGRLEELQVLMPDDQDVAELRERVENEQSSRLEDDMRVARARLQQLISTQLWHPAGDLIVTLQSKYPGKSEPAELAEELRREREAFERESMERLFRDIAAATERKQWRQAALAVEEFIRHYPLDSRAEALRLDLPTLRENSASQERKEQEAHFKDLLKSQRYEEAIAVARAVMQKYPQSPTAAELNKLLPRVEELAKQEAARQAAQAAAAATPAAAAT